MRRAFFYLRLDRRRFHLEIRPQFLYFGFPAISVFRHHRQAVFQALVLPFGRLALGLPLVTTPTEESKQLGNRTPKRQ
jgi:hypothetical protein